MKSEGPPSPLVAVAKVAPKLAELTAEVLLGDIWERPGLSKRERSLITVAVLAALCRPDQLRSHIKRALKNGVSRDEIGEVLTHIAFYAGWPAAISAALIAEVETTAANPTQGEQDRP